MAYSSVSRFLELPVEVRYIIYRELLCSLTFEDNALARILNQNGPDNGMNRALHPIHTSILRVNHEINREAYDVMMKTNQFIYVSSSRFRPNLRHVFQQHQVPFLTMNRAHVLQFRDYMMYVYIETIQSPPQEMDGEQTVFMMLGRHWENLCAALSHPTDPSIEFSMDLAFPTCSTVNRSQCMASTPYSFHCKTQKSFLNCAKTHLRGVKDLRIYGTTHPELSSLIQEEVTAPPIHTRPQWLSSPNQWSHLAHDLQRQNRHIEAFGLWNVVHQTPSHNLHEILDMLSCKRLRFASNLGTALCCLHYLEPTQRLTLPDDKFAEIKNLAEQFIRAARKCSTSGTDRARVLSLKCRLYRIECLRRNNRSVGSGRLRHMNVLLFRAERHDRFDPMVVDERWRFRWFRSRIEVDGECKPRRQQPGPIMTFARHTTLFRRIGR